MGMTPTVAYSVDLAGLYDVTDRAGKADRASSRTVQSIRVVRVLHGFCRALWLAPLTRICMTFRHRVSPGAVSLVGIVGPLRIPPSSDRSKER
jgi:hypothetical protein